MRRNLFIILAGLLAYAPPFSHGQNLQEKVLFIDSEISLQSFDKKWTQLSGTSDGSDSIANLLEILGKTPTGKNLIELARVRAGKDGKSLEKVLSVGESSFTDTSMIRRYSPQSPHDIEIEFKSIVSINKDLVLLDATLDLAHELTHFIYRRRLNPYEEKLSLEKFIKSTVEGRGGEVDAYLNECKVLMELFPDEHPDKERKNYHCHKVLDPKTKVPRRDLSVKAFYRVGNYWKDFLITLHQYGIDEKASFLHLSGDDSVFISSAYGLPYPVAAWVEYESIVKKVCLNEHKRLQVMKENGLSIELTEKEYFHKCEGPKINI